MQVRKYNLNGRVTEVQRPGKKKSFYSYDPADRILQVKHSDGTFESFSYRKDGVLMEATNNHSTIRLERDILGQLVRERQGDLTVESVYDGSFPAACAAAGTGTA